MDGEEVIEKTDGYGYYLDVDRWLETASELYDQVDFKTDALFNKPAPGYKSSFIVGGVSFWTTINVVDGIGKDRDIVL
jgi:hypothetical protein